MGNRLWVCSRCTENVATEQIKVPSECPECGCNHFSRIKKGREQRYLGTDSDSE